MSKIYKRGSTWYVDYTDAQGQRIRQSAGTKIKKEAEILLAKIETEVFHQKRLGLTDTKRYSWQDAVIRYLDEKKTQKSIRTTKEVLRYLDAHLRHKMLDEIDRKTVDAIRQHKQSTGVSAGTVNRTMTVLRAVLNAAKDWEWLDNTPKVKLLPDHAGRVRWLTQDEIERLLNVLSSHLKAMFVFSLATGLRESNVTRLQWSQVDLARRTAWISSSQSKSGKAIAVPLNDDAVQVLRGQLGKHLTYVFTYKDKPILKANSSAWHNALKRANVDYCQWHVLRHTWATRHIMNGTPLEVLMKLGGWASMDMVLRYAHLSNDYIKNYAENSASVTNSAQLEKTQHEKIA